MPQHIYARKRLIDMQKIHDTGAWNDKILNRRMLAISNKDFFAHWKERWVTTSFFVVGDYFLCLKLMPHNGLEPSYLCYNPKSNKLSIAYREVLWNSEWEGMNEKAVIHVATEEDSFPLEICQAGFGEEFYTDSLVYLSSSPFNDVHDEVIIPVASDYILSEKYDKALKILEYQYDSTCIKKIDVWDSINYQRFVEFRDYLLTQKKCKVYTPLLLECIEKSIQIFSDVESLNVGMWWPTCNLKFEDGIPSMEYAIKAYQVLNKENQYDSCLAQCYYELATYQLNYVEHLDVNTRENIKENFMLAHSYFKRLKNPKCAIALYWLGFEYKQEKDFNNAITYVSQALKFAQYYYGIESHEYVMVLDLLRDIFYAINEYDKASILARQYVKLVNEQKSPPHCYAFPLQTDNYVHLPSIYSDRQAEQEYYIFSDCTKKNVRNWKLKDIEEYYKNKYDWYKVVQLRKEQYENETEPYLKNDHLNALISAYHQIGDFESEVYYKQIWVDEIKEQYGEESEEYALALLELCKIYQLQNKNEEAFKCAERAIYIESKDKEHYKLLEILKGYGDYAVWSNKYVDAEFCYEQIINIRENTFGIGYLNDTKVSDLEPLVNVYLLMGDTIKAINTIQEIIRLGKQPDGREIHNYKFLGDIAERINNDTAALACYHAGGLYNDVERVLYRNNDFRNAEYFIRHHFDSLKREINQKIIFERENERERIWNKNNYYITQVIPQYCYEAYLDSVDYATLAYDVALFTKGYLLSTSQMIRNIIMSSDDEKLKKQWRELLMLQDVINQPLTKDSLVLLQERARYMEQQILKSNTELLLATQRQFYTWSDIKKKLKRNEVAIEFISYYDSIVDTRRYSAVLLKKKFKYPIYIPLFTEHEIHSLIEFGPEFLYGNSETPFNMVWEKLIPYINTNDVLYFAPEGVLHGVNIELFANTVGNSISDFCNQVVRVSSTREIIGRRGDKKKTSAMLYGGIQYDTNIEEMRVESMQYEYISILASRGIETDTLDRGSVKYLSGTKKEVEVINTLLNQHNVSSTMITSNSANEESFKALSGYKKNIIHIGTHGFYWSDSLARNQEYFSPNKVLSKIDPLNRCGLLLAGANIALRGKSKELPIGVQDGILTAKEISLLDLRDCDLVVLSACETGKGDITSDGVFGLQRAFKMAGTQTIIMSLWPVNDSATQMLMTEFYNNWIVKKQSKREAFKNAQNAVRAKYEEPEYWAGFVMLD
ncbi:MAG: CHAT domain-containing protein [Clostridia bacterium]|nr:CHAT domain-containing protein [Clostridia bacterium]